MNKTIIVMCGVDTHLGRIQRLLPQMRELWGDTVSFGIGNFAAVNTDEPDKLTQWPSIRYPYPSSDIPAKLREFAKDNDIEFYAAPRQLFIPAGREQHCCEVLGLFEISKHFYDIGFDFVYLIHTDIKIENDFLPFLDSLRKGNWNFIVPEILGNRKAAVDEPLRVKGRDDETYWRMRMINTTDIKDKREQPSRASLEWFIFNKAFVYKMYEIYGTVESMWDKMFCNFPMWADVGLYNICEDFFGYDAIFVKPFLIHPANKDE